MRWLRRSEAPPLSSGAPQNLALRTRLPPHVNRGCGLRYKTGCHRTDSTDQRTATEGYSGVLPLVVTHYGEGPSPPRSPPLGLSQRLALLRYQAALFPSSQLVRWSPRSPTQTSISLPPSRASLPLASSTPSSTSRSLPPRRVSSPPWPIRTSLPPRPQITSSPRVPIRASLPEVPSIVHSVPPSPEASSKAPMSHLAPWGPTHPPLVRFDVGAATVSNPRGRRPEPGSRA